MTVSVRSYLMAGVAVIAASAVGVAPSVAPPIPEAVASPSIELSAAVQPLTTEPDTIPSLADEIRMGIVPSLGAPFPTPQIPGPSPASTGFEDAIKNTYNVIEPWVRYGFELGTYAAGWVPFVGWLSPQIMIFYNFGERIVRSLVFNSADWLWGPLPFLQGLGNVARDSWNALVQLGVDEWNFWLPSLPPLPFAAQQTTRIAASFTTAVRPSGQAALADVLQAPLRQRLKVPNLVGAIPAGAIAATVRGAATRAEQALSNVATEVASVPAAVTNAGQDVAGGVQLKVPASVASVPDLNPPNAPVLKGVAAPRKVADAVVAIQNDVQGSVAKLTDADKATASGNAPHAADAVGKAPATVAKAVRDSVSQAVSHGDAATAHKSAQDPGQKKSEQQK